MSKVLDKSESGNIVVPGIVYESPQRMLVVDPAQMSAHLDVASDFASEDAKELRLKARLIQKEKTEETDPVRLKRLDAAEDAVLEQLADAEDMAKMFYNLSVFLRTKAKTDDPVVIPCPARLAEILWKARPTQGDPPSFRDWNGWWNFDAYRLDDYVPPAIP